MIKTFKRVTIYLYHFMQRHIHTRAHIVLIIFGELIFILVRYEYVKVINSVYSEQSRN